LGTSIVEALAKQLDGHVAITGTPPHGPTVSITHGSFDSELPKAAQSLLFGGAKAASIFASPTIRYIF